MGKVILDDFPLIEDERGFVISLVSFDHGGYIEIAISKLGAKRIELAKEIAMTQSFESSFESVIIEEEEFHVSHCEIEFVDDETIATVYISSDDGGRELSVDIVSAICTAIKFKCIIEMDKECFKQNIMEIPLESISVGASEILPASIYELYNLPQLSSMLDKAISEEAYDVASKIRDEIKKNYKYPN